MSTRSTRCSAERQGGGEVDGGRGFADAPFLVGDGEDAASFRSYDQLCVCSCEARTAYVRRAGVNVQLRIAVATAAIRQVARAQQCSTWNTDPGSDAASHCENVSRLCSASTRGMSRSSAAAEPASGASGPLGPRNRKTSRRAGGTPAASAESGLRLGPPGATGRRTPRAARAGPAAPRSGWSRPSASRARALEPPPAGTPTFCALTSTIVSVDSRARPASAGSRESRRRNRCP